MRTFKDTRGRSWFDLVSEIPWQVDMTVSYPGTIRAFHLHKEKIEWLFVARGQFQFILTDPQEEVFLSEGEMIAVTPGRWHGYKNIGETEGIVIEIADQKHSLEVPDDYREQWNKFADWEKVKK